MCLVLIMYPDCTFQCPAKNFDMMTWCAIYAKYVVNVVPAHFERCPALGTKFWNLGFWLCGRVLWAESQHGKPYLTCNGGFFIFFPRICSKVELEFKNKMGWKNDENMFQEGAQKNRSSGFKMLWVPVMLDVLMSLHLVYFVQALFVQSVPPPMLQPKRKPQTSVDRLGHIAYHMFFKAFKQYIIQNHTVYIVCRYTLHLIFFVDLIFRSCFFLNILPTSAGNWTDIIRISVGHDLQC